MAGIFGRKKTADIPGSRGSGGTPPPPGAQPVGFPWRELPEAGVCNLAVADIINNFATSFQTEGQRVHAETMLSGLGGVTGFAAQIALRSLIASGARTTDEGFPKLDNSHRPASATAELMKRSWPYTKMMLCQAYPQKPGPLGPVPPLLWPAVTAHAAATLLRKTAAVLDARLGLEILMQSAIYGSKLDANLFC